MVQTYTFERLPLWIVFSLLKITSSLMRDSLKSLQNEPSHDKKFDTHDNDYNGARIVRTTNVTYHGELHPD